jgi:Flavin containing amine oxidoreductase
MAGLTCARELLLRGAPSDVRVCLVEAASEPGGRVRACSALGGLLPLDLGAEFVHGKDTVLTELIDELFDYSHEDKDLYEPIFITSHADGGPDAAPTATGKYGMYYVDGELKLYNDPVIQQLSAVLAGVLHESTSASLGDALDTAQLLPASLRTLAVASYANTAGCSDLHQLSLPMIRRFETHWETNETGGDFRLPASIGMKGVVDALVRKLLHCCQGEGTFKLQCDWKVQRIRENNGDHVVRPVEVVSTTGEMICADVVVVTVPPPMLKELDMELSNAKLKALSFVGFERIVKVFCKFSTRHWPENLQSVVCADNLPIPEIWFLELKDSASTSYVAVGYLTSNAADTFMKAVQSRTGAEGIPRKAKMKETAMTISIQQLAQVLSIPEILLAESCVDCLVYDWKDDHPTVQGGYMYPITGMTVQHLQDLAAPDGRVLFAGEATNNNACCTLQAAMETGIRAAGEVRLLLGLSGNNT